MKREKGFPLGFGPHHVEVCQTSGTGSKGRRERGGGTWFGDGGVTVRVHDADGQGIPQLP